MLCVVQCNIMVSSLSPPVHRPKTVFEVIAEMWNSRTYNPVAPPSTCHIDFQTATDCSFQAVSTLNPATPQKVQDIFASLRSNLFRIIQNWERSGQGEGGTDETEDFDDVLDGAVAESGDAIRGLKGRPARTLDSRAAFLYGKPSYLLYFWEIADRHQLLQSSLQRLNESVGASDAFTASSVINVPRTASRRRRREDNEDDEEEVASALENPLEQSIRDFAKDEDRRQVALLQSQSERRVFQRRAQLVDEARKYRRLMAELDPNDPRTKRLSDFYLKETLDIEKEISDLVGEERV
jgi:hypothetical protein